MNAADPFFDTNVLVYLASADTVKADRAEHLLSAGGVVSVQVLNEFASVALGKLAFDIAEVREVLDAIRSLCVVRPVDVATHDLGLDLVKRYGFPVYDSMIVAAALLAESSILYSEDYQHGQRIERLTIRNPFLEG